jgi:hypothetical protein
MESNYAIGHYLTLVKPNLSVYYRFQNFFINQTVEWVNGPHTFLPFGFSGVSIDRDGGNVESTLLFPNNQLSREWAARSIEEFWIARVRVVLVDPDDVSLDKQTLLHNYVGQITAGSWKDAELALTLSSVLDAVGGDVPNRRLSRVLCGHLPVTSNVTF